MLKDGDLQILRNHQDMKLTLLVELNKQLQVRLLELQFLLQFKLEKLE